MIRKIVHIDEEKCNGCGLCAKACHEGAIEMVNGKAHLISDSYCDGFGDCLPECPAGAITITEREAEEYDREAVKERMKMRQEETEFHGCPGSRLRMINRDKGSDEGEEGGKTIPSEAFGSEGTDSRRAAEPVSRLTTWPVQLRLVPVVAPFFSGAKLLIAADCTAYAYARFHEDFIRNHVVLVGCPKLDPLDYTDKLQAIIERNDIKSVTIVRMEVPCCGGLQYAAENALKNSGKFLPWNVVTIGIDGRVVED
ncbi:ATP-binding protein [Bilifractor sp. LCP21S3_A7]|uniref:ATP-binding protein n=1 Tax=Bilifractor sp. LCP21S3_A7 TaxID=3438738 RepID=UPI003F9229FA